MSNNTITQKSPLLKSLGWLEKRAVRLTAALLGLALVLGVMTVNIIKYENHLANGDSVLLELAPVDPRGFMQGDYMTLRYALEAEVFNQLDKKFPENQYYINATEGYVIVTLDNNKVGKFSRLIDTKPTHLAANEMAIHYRVRNDTMKLATNAFFFQEGHAEAFEAAQYGLFRVNDKGEPLLTEMVNDKFEIIKGVNSKTESADDAAL